MQKGTFKRQISEVEANKTIVFESLIGMNGVRKISEELVDDQECDEQIREVAQLIINGCKNTSILNSRRPF